MQGILDAGLTAPVLAVRRHEGADLASQAPREAKAAVRRKPESVWKIELLRRPQVTLRDLMVQERDGTFKLCQVGGGGDCTPSPHQYSPRPGGKSLCRHGVPSFQQDQVSLSDVVPNYTRNLLSLRQPESGGAAQAYSSFIQMYTCTNRSQGLQYPCAAWAWGLATEL